MHFRKQSCTDLFDKFEKLGRRLGGWEAVGKSNKSDCYIQGNGVGQRNCRPLR
jgi:hypothetical protein